MVPVPEQPNLLVTVFLTFILCLVLVLPLRVHVIEKNLEYFFALMGLLSIGGVYTLGLVSSELLDEVFSHALFSPVSIGGKPIGITQVVLLAGLAFGVLGEKFYSAISNASRRLGLPLLVFVVVLALGLSSSLISAIVASVVAAEILRGLPVGDEKKRRIAVVACFSIGAGAALTPVGEPLSTIAVSKLSGEPYHAGFWFLVDLLGPIIVPLILGLSIYAAFIARGIEAGRASSLGLSGSGSRISDAFTRAFRVYVFVFALELLGASFSPISYWYLRRMPDWAVYWFNTISAVLDNATLTAAEISPALSIEQIRSALMSLIISGGILIPGNVPNIVVAARLDIGSREWARIGLPLGFALLAACFPVVELL
ncbi:MAG: DUF1646 family protein [Fervidicoccaceae archaeon]